MTEQQIIETIEARRVELGMSKLSLAIQAGITEKAYRHISHGEASPKISNIVKICKVLGIEITLYPI